MELAGKALDGLWRAMGGATDALSRVTITGDRELPSVFEVDAAGAASIAAAGLAAAELWQARTGRSQEVTLDTRAAAATFRSERYTLRDGVPMKDGGYPLHGFYRCRDGRWIQLHTAYPLHRMGVLEFLGCAANRPAVEQAIARRDGFELEDALAARGLPCAVMRTAAEWASHPQGAAVAALPPMEILRIGDAAPRPFSPDPRRPLEGMRAVELTKVIAGPCAGRTLAEHGAEVLWLSGPHMALVHGYVMDHGRGKRPAFLDLRRTEGRELLAGLVADADLFVQGYRPGTIAARGFGPEEVAALRPGIVYASLSAWSHEGPWSDRRGFDSLVQQASGIAAEGSAAACIEAPKHLPCQTLDHASGFLAAAGAMIARTRQAREGGSWLVRVSLAQTAEWLKSLGRVEGGLDLPDPGLDRFADLLETRDGPFGRLAAPRPAAVLSETPGRWLRPPSPFGTYSPRWLDVA